MNKAWFLYKAQQIWLDCHVAVIITICMYRMMTFVKLSVLQNERKVRCGRLRFSMMQDWLAEMLCSKINFINWHLNCWLWIKLQNVLVQDIDWIMRKNHTDICILVSLTFELADFEDPLRFVLASHCKSWHARKRAFERTCLIRVLWVSRPFST